MTYTVGQIVYSKCGRDEGRAFVVVKIENGYVYLADGKLRLLNKPKRKKMKHVQTTHTISDEMKEKLENNRYILDADIRRFLKKYSGRAESGKGGF